MYGPHSALLYGRRSSLLRLSSLNHFNVNTETAAHQKLLVGGLGYESTYSVSAVLEYLCSLGGLFSLPPLSATALDDETRSIVRGALTVAFDRIAAHESVLAERALDIFSKYESVEVIGEVSPSSAARVPTFSFVVKDTDSASVPTKCLASKVGIKAGTFHSSRLTDALGLADRQGVVRVSFVHYNTVDEVDAFGEALKNALA